MTFYCSQCFTLYIGPPINPCPCKENKNADETF
jgi:hypothetical protein